MSFLLWFITALCSVSLVAKETTCLTRFGEAPKYNTDQVLPYAKVDAPQSGTLRLSAMGSFTSLNAHLVGKAPAYGLDQCYETMMMRAQGEPFTLYPRLAEKVTLAPDNSWIIFHIDPEACFSNGTPVTAEDAKHTYETLVQHSFPRYRQYFKSVKQIEVINDKTLKVYFLPKDNQAYDPELPMIIAMVPVYSKAQLTQQDFDKTAHTQMIGSGPYMVESCDMGHSITYVKNPHFWAAKKPMYQGSWNFDRIKVDYYQNAQALFQAFLAGECDIHFETNLNQWISGYKHVKAIREGRMKQEEVTHGQPVMVRTFALNMRKPIFSDWAVRRALVLAFDFDTMNRIVFDGMMKCPNSLFANTHLNHSGKPEGLEKTLLEAEKSHIDTRVWQAMMEGPFSTPHDQQENDQRAALEEADRLLTDAGCIMKNGVRLNKEGKPFEIELLVKDPKLEKIGLEYSKSLKRLGIVMHVRMMDSVQYENRVMEFQFDVIIHAWSNSLSPGNEQVYYVSAKTAEEKGSSNYIGITDPVGERLANHIAQAKDAESHKAAVHAFDRWMMNQCYQVPIAYDNTLRFAYYQKRIAFPPIDTQVGMNIVRFGWSIITDKDEMLPATESKAEPWWKHPWKSMGDLFNRLLSK